MNQSFKQYLTEAVKPMKDPKELDLEQVVKVLRENCSIALEQFQKGKVLYRGDMTFPDRPAVIDPSSGKRVSINTTNHYTNFFETNPENAGWPKRSKSLICSTSPVKAREFGTMYLVFPFDGVALADVGRKDMWDARVNLGIPMNIKMLNYFWDALEKQRGRGELRNFKTAGKLLLNISDKDLDALANARDTEVRYPASYLQSIKADSESGFIKEVNKLFDLYDFNSPKQKFELHDSVDGVFAGTGSREIWFSGKCVVVPKSEEKRLKEILLTNDIQT